MLHLTQPFIDPGDQLSFETSFKTCSAGHQSTTSVLLQADTHRHAIKKSMADGKLYYPALSKSLLEYMYVIHLLYLLFTLSIIIYYFCSHLHLYYRSVHCCGGIGIWHCSLCPIFLSRPLINQILLSCKFQPESVTLDSKSIVNINISSHLIIRQS